MSHTVENSTNRIIGQLYAGMTKESIRADINAMTFKPENERGKAYNKHIKLFDYANSLVSEGTDDEISEREIEAYNKKVKTKKIWETAGFAALGIGVAIGTYMICKNVKQSQRLLALTKNKNACLNQKLKTLAEHENVSPDMFKPVFEETRTSYKYAKSGPLKDFSPLLNSGLKDLGFSTNPQFGRAYLRGSQNIPLGTSGVGDCAVIFMYNTNQKTHAMYHAMNIDKNIHAENIMKIMPEGFDKIVIVPGTHPNTANTSVDLFNSAKKINPKALVEFKHSEVPLRPLVDGECQYVNGHFKFAEYISYNGEVYERPMYGQWDTAFRQPQISIIGGKKHVEGFLCNSELSGGYLIDQA